MHEKPASAPDVARGDELADELDSTVVTLGRLFSARHGEMCSESGLSASQMLTLRVLGEAGPMKISDLAMHVGVKAPAASAMVDALDKRGHIRREADVDDRRVTLVRLTDEGAAELAAVEAERREHMRRYLSVLSEDDVSALIRIHRKLIDAMTSDRI
jgi:DNA-binding MarR family transcriptional regulator